jgi:coiled-coil domain-containing protein 102A
VRNERNKAREEAKLLKDNLDHVLKENSSIKREKQNLEQQNECLRKELEKVNLILLKHAGIVLKPICYSEFVLLSYKYCLL